jgi:hypothetical protein
MLERTLQRSAVIGSNLPEDQLPTSWLFLLPDLALGRVAVIGDVPPATIGALRALGATIEITTPEELVGSVDLIVVGSLASAIDASALPSGTTVAAAPGAVIGLAPSAWLAPGRSIPTPAGTHTGPHVMATGFPTRSSAAPSSLRRARRVADRLLARASRRLTVHPGDRARSLAVTSSPPPDGAIGTILQLRDDPRRLPRYIVDVAAAAGVQLDDHGWSVVPQAMYPSQKVVFLVTPPHGDEPELVVKVTRRPEHAVLLRREHDGLVELASMGIAHGAPRALFLGEHAGLAVHGQTVAHGDPLVRLASPDPTCAVVDRAASWLLDVARRTATPGTAADAAGALGEVVRRYAEVYAPPQAERDALSRHLESVARSPGPVPSVFQHGDSGVWNVMVSPSGALTFLDWENADPQGVPLWDLLYLTQTHGSASAARRGVRYTAKTFAAQILGPSPWRDVLDRRLRRCADELDLDPATIDALTTLLWVHLAVKESSRLAPQRLVRSRYRRYVQAVIGR